MLQNEKKELPEKQLMSIGEVARVLGITRRIILNYEAKGLLTADKKEGTVGNRYYTPDSISRIRSIRVLQKLGLSLDEIAAYYKDSMELEPLIERLEALRDELTQNIEKLKQRAGTTDFKILTLPAQTVYCRKTSLGTVEERKDFLREIFMTALRLYGSDDSKRMFFTEYALDHPGEVTCYISVPAASVGENVVRLQEQKALCIFYRGCYESLPKVRETLLAQASARGLALSGIARHTYLEGPPQHKDPANYITQVALLLQ